jgi:hypothetical protein
MVKKIRDFYHIQDQIPLTWRYAASLQWVDSGIDVLSDRINELAQRLSTLGPDAVEFVDLVNQKIDLLEKALAREGETQAPVEHTDLAPKEEVEVSLSSSGIGFFSKLNAEEEASIDLFLTLETLQTEVQMEATVLECRLSADSENPGYWIRVRFSRNQEQKIDKLLAHVTQRQIDKLNKKPNATPQS